MSRGLEKSLGKFFAVPSLRRSPRLQGSAAASRNDPSAQADMQTPTIGLLLVQERPNGRSAAVDVLPAGLVFFADAAGMPRHVIASVRFTGKCDACGE